MKIKILIGVLSLILVARVSFATGYEKPIMFSGKYAGVAGAAASSVSGAESLAFNPAGLAASPSKADLVLDLSPFLIQAKGPVLSQASSLTQGAADQWGQTILVPAGGFFAGTKLGDSLGIGVGYFVVAGGGAKYGDVDFGTAFPTLHPEAGGSLGFSDLSIGAGYQVLPSLRIGAAWRASFVSGTTKVGLPISSVGGAVPDTLYALDFEDMKATAYNGFRFGAQYAPTDASWGLGVNVRTGITVNANGTGSARTQSVNSADINTVTGGRVTLNASLPWQVAAGAHFAVSDPMRLFFQYEFTNYSNNKIIAYSGDKIGLLDPSVLTSTVEWMNLHAFRLGSQYQLAPSLVLRGGAALLTQVTRTNHTYFGEIPPGPTYTFVLGAGKDFMDGALGLDAALDFTRAVGTGRDSTSLGFLDGNYQNWAATIHTAVSYRF